MKKHELVTLLSKHGMRATSSRLQVLLFLEEQQHPVGVEVLKEMFPKINEVTLYRMASDFVQAGIWHSYDVGHGHVDFETASRPHHHHAVCESCGTIEEVYGCRTECQLIQSLSQKVKTFRSLKAPHASIFGTCNRCV